MLGGPRLPQTKLKPVSGTTPSVDIQVLRQHLVELKQEGFTIFRDFLPRDVVGQLRQVLACSDSFVSFPNQLLRLSQCGP